jgi:hypothetical protein
MLVSVLSYDGFLFPINVYLSANLSKFLLDTANHSLSFTVGLTFVLDKGVSIFGPGLYTDYCFTYQFYCYALHIEETRKNPVIFVTQSKDHGRDIKV